MYNIFEKMCRCTLKVRLHERNFAKQYLIFKLINMFLHQNVLQNNLCVQLSKPYQDCQRFVGGNIDGLVKEAFKK